eukprot:gene9889-10046_t
MDAAYSEQFFDYDGHSESARPRPGQTWVDVMSFLLRSSSRRGNAPSHVSKSFSIRTGRRDADSILPAVSEPTKEFLAAGHFLRTETQAARAAVDSLDKYSIKLVSFQDKGIELLEEAHRALSRLEHSVATSAAPELIVVACEVKVACHRGLHLFRTYGRYHYLGKVIALATRSSVTAKYDAVIVRLKAIMPLGNHTSAAAPAAAAGGPTSSKLEQTTFGNWQGSSALNDSPCSTPRAGSIGAIMAGSAGGTPFDRTATTSSMFDQHLGAVSSPASNGGSTSAAATGVLAGMLKGSAGTSNLGTGVGSSGGGSATPLAVLLRSAAHDKVTGMVMVPPEVDGDAAGAASAACVWWAVGGKLEFFSGATQSTTSFAGTQSDKAALTALVVDNQGNVWSGTARGSIVMRRRHNWQQVYEEKTFSSSVRCLAADEDSDVVWAGDDSGSLAVLRCWQGSSRMECTATILPAKAGAKASKHTGAAAADVKPSSLARRRSFTCRGGARSAAEGPIRAMLVRDDRAWVAGGRTEPWIGLFDAVLGAQLDMWLCGLHGGCVAMGSMLTAAALSERNATCAATAQSANSLGSSNRGSLGGAGGMGTALPESVPEDGIAENPRSSWRLVTGHDSGQLLLWSAASDKLQPLVIVGDSSQSPVKAVAVLEQQGLVAVAHANGDLSLFLRPVRDDDWLLAGGRQHKSSSGGLDRLRAAGDHSSSGGSGIRQSTDGAARSNRMSFEVSGSAGAAGGDLLDADTDTMDGSDCSTAGAAAGALHTIKPSRVMLKTHRSAVACAAACTAGIATASSLGAIKLWTADSLAREAERGGLVVPMRSLMSESSRGPCLQGPAAVQQAPSQPLDFPSGLYGAPPAAAAGSGHGSSFALQSGLYDLSHHSLQPPGSRGSLGVLGPMPGTGNTVGNLGRRPSYDVVSNRHGHWDRTDLPAPRSGGAVVPHHFLDAAGAAAAAAGAGGCGAEHLLMGRQPGSGGLGGSSSGTMGPEVMITAPRAPRAQRLAAAAAAAAGGGQDPNSRERRKSERRLSKGAQIAASWNTCQIIESRELKLINCIGSGAYGK